MITNNISMEIRNFLWQGGKVRYKKFHLIKWDVVKAPKFNGGLGIRDLEQMNKALGAKLVWRMVTGNRDWWKEVIKKIYIYKESTLHISLSSLGWARHINLEAMQIFYDFNSIRILLGPR